MAGGGDGGDFGMAGGVDGTVICRVCGAGGGPFLLVLVENSFFLMDGDDEDSRLTLLGVRNCIKFSMKSSSPRTF